MYKLGLFLCVFLVVVVQNSDATFAWYDCWMPISFPSAGPDCKANLKKWRWDMVANECIKVTFNGCNPSNNHFETQKLCEAAAGSMCKFGFPFTFFPELLPALVPDPPTTQ